MTKVVPNLTRARNLHINRIIFLLFSKGKKQQDRCRIPKVLVPYIARYVPQTYKEEEIILKGLYTHYISRSTLMNRFAVYARLLFKNFQRKFKNRIFNSTNMRKTLGKPTLDSSDFATAYAYKLPVDDMFHIVKTISSPVHLTFGYISWKSSYLNQGKMTVIRMLERQPNKKNHRFNMSLARYLDQTSRTKEFNAIKAKLIEDQIASFWRSSTLMQID